MIHKSEIYYICKSLEGINLKDQHIFGCAFLMQGDRS